MFDEYTISLRDFFLNYDVHVPFMFPVLVQNSKLFPSKFKQRSGVHILFKTDKKKCIPLRFASPVAFNQIIAWSGETKKRRIYFSLCRITGRIPSGRESTLQVLPRVATISSGCLLPQVMLAHLQLQHAKNSNFFITCAYPKAKILPNEKKKMIVKLLKKVIHLRKLRGGGGICAFLAIVKVLAKVLLERRATPRLVDREQI